MAKQEKPKKAGARKAKPIVLSINICDIIIRDEKTKKVSLIGLFGNINAYAFPVQHPLMHVYIALTNGHGKYKINIQFVRVADNDIIVEMEGEIDFPDPLGVVEMNLEWRGIQFEKPGTYSVEVLCEGSPIGSRKFNVRQLQKQIPPTKGTEGT